MLPDLGHMHQHQLRIWLTGVSGYLLIMLNQHDFVTLLAGTAQEKSSFNCPIYVSGLLLSLPRKPRKYQTFLLFGVWDGLVGEL